MTASVPQSAIDEPTLLYQRISHRVSLVFVIPLNPQRIVEEYD